MYVLYESTSAFEISYYDSMWSFLLCVFVESARDYLRLSFFVCLDALAGLDQRPGSGLNSVQIKRQALRGFSGDAHWRSTGIYLSLVETVVPCLE